MANAVFISTFSAIAGSKTGDTFNDTFSGIAIDGQKIIITFDKIAPDALLTFTQFAPVPKSEFEGIDPLQVQQAPFFQHPIGCGLFMVEEVNMKNYTILAPFDKYYNGVADFKIQLLPSAGDSDPNVVTRAKSGNLDYGYTKMVADVQALEGTPGITVTLSTCAIPACSTSTSSTRRTAPPPPWLMSGSVRPSATPLTWRPSVRLFSRLGCPRQRPGARRQPQGRRPERLQL